MALRLGVSLADASGKSVSTIRFSDGNDSVNPQSFQLGDTMFVLGERANDNVMSGQLDKDDKETFMKRLKDQGILPVFSAYQSEGMKKNNNWGYRAAFADTVGFWDQEPELIWSKIIQWTSISLTRRDLDGDIQSITSTELKEGDSISRELRKLRMANGETELHPLAGKVEEDLILTILLQRGLREETGEGYIDDEKMVTNLVEVETEAELEAEAEEVPETKEEVEVEEVPEEVPV
tara:strand:+ start:123 stop:830 length:708 start_codon:yes stop_codon:yes gene_type:complete